MAQQDLLELLGPLRPPYRWLLIGPRRSGSTLHKAIPDGEYLLGTAGWLFQSSMWVNYNDLTATEPWNHDESWSVREIIPQRGLFQVIEML